MRVLVLCEFSGIVSGAFRSRGHEAWSCDLLPTEGDPQWHIQGDMYDAARSRTWDAIIGFLPCTFLAVSGARWFKERQQEQRGAIQDVRWFFSLPCAKLGLENPIGVLSTKYRKPDQIIQPWMFGHGETKATCLWLKNLPPLVPTNVVEGRHGRVWREPPGPDRWKNRSRTYQGVADAMADQWGATT